MTNKNEKSSGYLELTLEAMREMVDQAKDRTDLKESLEDFLAAKLKQSFKNGVEVGLKRQRERKEHRRE